MYQITINKEIEFHGTGIHSGAGVKIIVKPAPINTGVVFFRRDIPGSSPIPALAENVVNSFRGTDLSVDGVSVKTVEHLLSTFRGLAMDNVFVDVYGPEIPIIDGSTWPFVKAVQKAGFMEQKDGEKIFFRPQESVWATHKDSHIILLPYKGLKITCVINYDHPQLQTQMEEIEIEPGIYTESICKARTYAFMEEVEYLLEKKLALGGSLDNALVIKKDGYSSPLRYPNEPVRHKILDLIGDMSLLGQNLEGHVLAIKSGHSLNLKFVKILREKLKTIN